MGSIRKYTGQYHVFKKFGRGKQTPHLFPAQNSRKRVFRLNPGQLKMIFWQVFTLQHGAQTVNRVFEIRLRRSFGAILKRIEILVHIFCTQFQRGTSEMQGYDRQMTAIACNGSFAIARNGQAAAETEIEYFKTFNLLDSTCYQVSFCL